VPTYIECRPRAYVENDPDVYHFCSVIAEEFNHLIEDWHGFHANTDLAVRESDAYGIGCMLFENEWDWRPQAFRRGNLLIDPKASVEIDKNEIYMVRSELLAGDLFELTEDEEISRKAGWKVSKIKQLLVDVYKKREENGKRDEEFQTSVWETLQRRYRHNDPDTQAEQFERVRVVHILVREVAGDQKVSHYIMPENGSEPCFIYEGLDKYEHMSHAIWWLPYNYGDGYARSIRGVASHMAQHDDLSNRYLCRVFDAGFMASSLLLQPRSQADMNRLQFINHGPYTVLPAELQAVQSTFQPQIAPLIQLRSVSEQVMKNNTGTYRQHAENVDGDAQKTARQVMVETSKEARYEKAAVVHRYNMFDLLYREIFRRASRKDYVNGEAKYPGKKYAKDFIDRCAARGVPKDFIYSWEKNIRIGATRAIGLGSLGVKYDITAQMLNVSGSFDEIGKNAALRDFVAARVGYGNSDKYVTKIDRDQITSNETSIATLEDNDMAEGSQVPVGHDQLHKAHLDTHAARVTPIIQAVETAQIQDPVQAYQTMSLEIPHMAQHLQYLSGDPRRQDYVKQISQFLQIAQSTLKKLEGMARRVVEQQQQQRAAEQQQVAEAQQVLRDRELSAKMAEIQREYELERFKQESLNAARAEKTAVQMDISRQKASADISRKAEKQAADIELDRQKTQADIAMKQASAQ
jgi:hypothetical protein